jgi:hypothetical protein
MPLGKGFLCTERQRWRFQSEPGWKKATREELEEVFPYKTTEEREGRTKERDMPLAALHYAPRHV